MPRRTLRQARRIFEEDVVPRVSDYTAGEHRQALAAAEQRARAQAEEHLAAQEQAVRQARDAALRELTDVRDAFEELTTEGQTGRVSVTAYAARLDRLAERQVRAEAQLQQAAEKVEGLERVEDDPIAWFDSLAQRFPHMQVEVPW